MLRNPLPRILLLAISLLAIHALSAVPARASLAVSDKWPMGDGACVDTLLRLTFSGPAHLGTEGKILIIHASDHAVADTFDLAAGKFTDTYDGKPLQIDPILIDGNTAIIHLHLHVLHNGEHYLVTVDPQVFLDDQNQPFSGLTETDGWAFTVRAAPGKPLEKRVVAADGTGDFCTVQGAVDDIPVPNTQKAVIFIKASTYDGLIRVGKGQDHISFVGEDRKKTILTGLNNDKWNPSVSQRSLIGVEGDDFIMQNLTVHNLTPYKGSQAESLWVNADRCVLRDDDFYSFQDTLCLNGRVYVADCYIEGDVDFIWGYGSVFFDQCDVHAVHNGYFVQARNPATKPGYIFSKCKLTCDAEVKKCWLARIAPATFPASQAAYLHCSMDQGVPPEGWKLDAPKGTTAASVVAGPQLQFEEYQSVDPQGQPLDVSHRLAGSKQLSDDEALALSDPAKVLAGTDQWNPTTSATSGN
jgi:pectin methylesterase-like acyl-CoA thioesterase